MKKCTLTSFFVSRSEINAPKNGETKLGVLLRNNVPAHRLGLVRDFLTKDNSSTLQHPPYYPDLASAESNLFCRLASALKDGAFVMLQTSLRIRQKST